MLRTTSKFDSTNGLPRSKPLQSLESSSNQPKMGSRLPTQCAMLRSEQNPTCCRPKCNFRKQQGFFAMHNCESMPPNTTEKFSSIGTFVSIPAPIFNRNQGNRISSRAFYLQQVREYERLKLALADQLSVALRQYKSLQNESRRLQTENHSTQVILVEHRRSIFPVRIITFSIRFEMTQIIYVPAC